MDYNVISLEQYLKRVGNRLENIRKKVEAGGLSRGETIQLAAEIVRILIRLKKKENEIKSFKQSDN